MLFNSYIFIFAFLPIIFAGYFILNKQRYTTGSKYWLIAGSLFFYSWWNIIYLPLMLLSIIVNYFITRKMQTKEHNKPLLYIGLAFNVGLLAYFKYADFFIENVNLALSTQLPLLNLALPLAISFFTLQQIAFLVDSYGGLVKEKDFTDYTLFVVFFPQLIAGPIVHHKEMMPQFATLRGKIINYKNIATGLFIFSIGLFKKVVIADTFAQWASAGFSVTEKLNMLEAWVTSLSYTFQLYFDFSGYTDMAIGIALLFNIVLPQNFNSPYKSISIIEFWSRWHMTLTRFLTTYIYNPLVKSFGKFSFHKAMFATFVTMFIAGIWHGAAWTFVIFGAVHGTALVINHYYKSKKYKMNNILAWFLTFNFLNLSFVIFRAESMQDAFNVFRGMFAGELVLNHKWYDKLVLLQEKVEFGAWMQNVSADGTPFIYIMFALIAVILFKNTITLANNMKPNVICLSIIILIFVISVLKMQEVSEFLYYNF